MEDCGLDDVFVGQATDSSTVRGLCDGADVIVFFRSSKRCAHDRHSPMRRVHIGLECPHPDQRRRSETADQQCSRQRCRKHRPVTQPHTR